MHFNPSAWDLVKRQSVAVPVIGAACYNAANEFQYVFQSIGLTGELCNPAGQFSTAYSALTSCTSAHSSDTAASTAYVVLATPLVYCSSYISKLVASVYAQSAADAYTASLCSSYASIQSSPAASLNLTCSQFSSSSITEVPSTTTSTSPTLSTSISQGPSTPTPTSTSTSASLAAASTTPTPSHLSTGAIAGIAVGAILGILALLSFIGFFIWRHRRAAKARKVPTNYPGTGAGTEKAQLHSDSYQPKREELEGSKAPAKVRVIPGLSELEYVDMKGGRGEMAANEVAAPELGGGSTLGASGTENSGSTVVQDGSSQSRPP